MLFPRIRCTKHASSRFQGQCELLERGQTSLLLHGLSLPIYKAGAGHWMPPSITFTLVQGGASLLFPWPWDLRLTGHQESRIQSLSPRPVSALDREEGRTSPAPRASGIREGWVILAAFFANRIPVGLSKNPIRERRRERRRTHIPGRPAPGP